MCERHCKGMGDKVVLKTVYRTSDEEHLVFLNRTESSSRTDHV